LLLFYFDILGQKITQFIDIMKITVDKARFFVLKKRHLFGSFETFHVKRDPLK